MVKKSFADENKLEVDIDGLRSLELVGREWGKKEGSRQKARLGSQ